MALMSNWEIILNPSIPTFTNALFTLDFETGLCNSLIQTRIAVTIATEYLLVSFFYVIIILIISKAPIVCD